MKQIYPDISDILSAKLQRRRALVALSWEDKVAIVEQMRTSLLKGQWKNRAAENRHAIPTNAIRERNYE